MCKDHTSRRCCEHLSMAFTLSVFRPPCYRRGGFVFTAHAKRPPWYNEDATLMDTPSCGRRLRGNAHPPIKRHGGCLSLCHLGRKTPHGNSSSSHGASSCGGMPMPRLIFLRTRRPPSVIILPALAERGDGV